MGAVGPDAVSRASVQTRTRVFGARKGGAGAARGREGGRRHGLKCPRSARWQTDERSPGISGKARPGCPPPGLGGSSTTGSTPWPAPSSTTPGGQGAGVSPSENRSAAEARSAPLTHRGRRGTHHRRASKAAAKGRSWVRPCSAPRAQRRRHRWCIGVGNVVLSGGGDPGVSTAAQVMTWTAIRRSSAMRDSARPTLRSLPNQSCRPWARPAARVSAMSSPPAA